MSGDPRKQIGSGSGSDVLRVALEAARRDAPDRAQLARLAARLPLGLPGGPGGGQGPGGPAEGGGPATGGGAAAPATGEGAAAPATGGAAAPATGGAGTPATGGAGTPATFAPPGIVATAAVAPPSVLSGLAAGAALGVVLVGAVWLMPSRSQPPRAAPGAAVVATAATAGAAAAPAAGTAEVPAEAPPVPPATEPPRAAAPEPPRAPSGAPLPARAPASTTGAPAAGGAAQAALPDAETELGLLQRAQEALAARPAEALALADAHLARFPGGALAQEREVIAVGALKALGRDGEALARANRFIASHPSSAYRRRLEILVPELRGAQR
ncbi:hypothetical protein [Sorangium sp. So ce233]|uniref:hypothetical protein n=1 Tax=Sorangium sp. So ce233 TaxID=3133290 RepID=UPI003F5F64B2